MSNLTSATLIRSEKRKTEISTLITKCMEFLHAQYPEIALDASFHKIMQSGSLMGKLLLYMTPTANIKLQDKENQIIYVANWSQVIKELKRLTVPDSLLPDVQAIVKDEAPDYAVRQLCIIIVLLSQNSAFASPIDAAELAGEHINIGSWSFDQAAAAVQGDVVQEAANGGASKDGKSGEKDVFDEIEDEEKVKTGDQQGDQQGEPVGADEVPLTAFAKFWHSPFFIKIKEACETGIEKTKEFGVKVADQFNKWVDESGGYTDVAPPQMH